MRKQDCVQSNRFRSQAGVAAFARSRIVAEEGNRISLPELYASYLLWWPDHLPPDEKATRKSFTGAMKELAAGIKYGPIRLNGKVARGFVGLRLATPADAMHDDIPDGPLSIAHQLLQSSRVPEGDIGIVADLMLTAGTSAWSRKRAIAILEDWAEFYPEVSQIISLIDLRYR